MISEKKKSKALIVSIVVASVILVLVILALAVLGYVYFRLNSIKRIPTVQTSSVEENFERDSMETTPWRC